MIEDIKRAFIRVFNDSIEDARVIDLGEFRGYIVYSKLYELTLRCDNELRCEAMLRYNDEPVITCTDRCVKDILSKNISSDLVEELKIKVEEILKEIKAKPLSIL